jgi:hypothetical protein
MGPRSVDRRRQTRIIPELISACKLTGSRDQVEFGTNSSFPHASDAYIPWDLHDHDGGIDFYRFKLRLLGLGRDS